MCRIHVARSCTALLACLFGMFAVLPASAVAATATTVTRTSSPDEVIFRASPGELNQVSITREASGVYNITDLASAIEPSGLCAAVDTHQVVCPAELARVVLGDGDDRIALTGAPGDTPSEFVRDRRFRGPYSVNAGEGDDRVDGSAADDVLLGGPGRDRLAGGDGDDLVSGGRGRDAVSGGDGGDLVLGGELAPFERGRPQPDEFDTLRGDAGNDLLVGGVGPDRLFGGSDNDLLLYDSSPEDVSVTFDGRANDGRRGERDHVGARDVEGVLLPESGRVALSGELGFGGGRYTMTGGRTISASVTLLSSSGTGSGSMEGRFSGTTFSVRLINPGGSLGRIEATGESRRRCGRGSASQHGFAPPRTEASYLALRRILARIRARRGRARAAAGPARAFQVVGRASAGTARGAATWLTTDICRGTLTKVKTGDVMLKRLSPRGVPRRTIRRLRGRARGRFRTGGRNSSAFVRG